jgi:hypothetical protein
LKAFGQQAKVTGYQGARFAAAGPGGDGQVVRSFGDRLALAPDKVEKVEQLGYRGFVHEEGFSTTKDTKSTKNFL